MEINLPKTLIEEISENELRLYLAMMLYKERKLSMGQAAKLAWLNPIRLHIRTGQTQNRVHQHNRGGA